MVSRTSRAAKVTTPTVFHFEEAVAGARHRIVVAPPLNDLAPLAVLRRASDGVLLELRDLLVHPLILAIAVRHRDADLLIIRYFTTKMLLLAAPLLWPFRKRLLFVIQNNMQLAHVGSRERRYFRLLCRLGFQLGFLEAMDGLAELGVRPDARQFVALPLPLYPEAAAEPPERPPGPPSIGVIGRELAEKNTDVLMRLLLGWRDAGQLAAEIVLGSNDTEVLASWAVRGVRVVQTQDYRDYVRAVTEVDVLLIHYERSHYFYRSSGVIHDAASLGTAVVCPDFPVFRQQVTTPCQVGAVYGGEAEMLPAIQAALGIARAPGDAFAIWRRARSPAEFSRRLDRFIERRP